ncbi:MAG: GNAT family N-acetyltransferase [Clostridia bacterium]|nr:GNAT family N-acetyltransferase [Clostridia bacterium]
METNYHTDRLRLRVLDGADAKRVYDYYDRNRDFLEEWDPHRPAGFYTVSYQQQVLEKEDKAFREGSMIKLWIEPRHDPSKVIGFIVFNNIIRGCFLSCHLGYKLDKDYINKGYITEALRKGIDIIFNDYQLHRIEANIMPKNVRSLRVAEKLGFYHEGIAKKYLKIHGIWEDHIHMVLLNDNV